MNFFVTGSIQENEPAWSEQTRRDMLSLNVEFVKINISRSRKIEVRALDKEAKSNIVRFSGEETQWQFQQSLSFLFLKVWIIVCNLELETVINKHE